jgi:hypothetical protein
MKLGPPSRIRGLAKPARLGEAEFEGELKYVHNEYTMNTHLDSPQ